MAEWIARLPLQGSRSVCTCQHHFHEMWCWLRQAPTLLFFNCTLQYTRIIVEYSVIVGRSLVWLETNLNPTMTILLFSSILSTKRQWQSSTNTRPVWQRQKKSQIQSKEAILDCQHQNGELARLWWCPDCDSQKVQHQAPSTALKSACPEVGTSSRESWRLPDVDCGADSKMAAPKMTSTKTWGEFFDPHWGGGARWPPFHFRPPSWMTSFVEPEMRSSKLAAGSGRAAILRLRLNGVEKLSPYYSWCPFDVSPLTTPSIAWATILEPYHLVKSR